MIQLQHGHPLHQGHHFSKIILFYRTMHLLQSGQDGLSHSEPHEFVLVPATPTRPMLPPRKFSHNIEHVDRASASQLAATPVGCQGSTETNPEHLKNGFNKTNPYLDMKEGQPVSHQHTPGLLSSQPWRQFTQYHPQEQVCRVLQNHIHLHHDVLGISSIHHPIIHGAQLDPLYFLTGQILGWIPGRRGERRGSWGWGSISLTMIYYQAWVSETDMLAWLVQLFIVKQTRWNILD